MGLKKRMCESATLRDRATRCVRCGIAILRIENESNEIEMVEGKSRESPRGIKLCLSADTVECNRSIRNRSIAPSSQETRRSCNTRISSFAQTIRRRAAAFGDRAQHAKLGRARLAGRLTFRVLEFPLLAKQAPIVCRAITPRGACSALIAHGRTYRAEFFSSTARPSDALHKPERARRGVGGK